MRKNRIDIGNLAVTKDEFIAAVNNSTSVNDLCERLSKSKPSVYTYAYRFNIPLKGRWVLKKLRGDGYKSYRSPENHRRKVESILGRKLKRGEVVHHIDGDKANNANDNLLVCTVGYHQELHSRMSYLYQQEHLKKVKG